MTISFAARVVGAIALVASAPLGALAASALTTRPLTFAGYFILTILIVGFLAALWFQALQSLFGRSRIASCVAGVLAAITTCVSYLGMFAAVVYITAPDGYSWSTTFVGFTLLTAKSFGLPILGAGLLAGLVASIKWFAP